jgi:hypothetical protein
MSIAWRPQQASTRPGDDGSPAEDNTAGYGEVRAVADLAGRPVWADAARLATGLAAFGVPAPLGALDNQPTQPPARALERGDQ